MTKEQKEAARKAAAARQAQQAAQSVTPPAPVSPPAKGTGENPWTGEDAPEDKAARAGQWLKLDNGKLFQFGAEGQGPQGNWRKTSNGDGTGASTSRKFNAARLNLPAAQFSALLPVKAEDGTPGTSLFAENRKAREAKAEIGLTLLQTIMAKVQVELPESPEKRIERPRTADEKKALFIECGGDFDLFALREAAQPVIVEVVPATKAGRVTLAELANQSASHIPAGVQSDARRFANEALAEALAVLSA